MVTRCPPQAHPLPCRADPARQTPAGPLAAAALLGSGAATAKRADSSQVTQATTQPAALALCHVLPAASVLAMSQRTPRNGSAPTVLLVHGAFADSSMWACVIAELQAAGIGVIALVNPLRGLASDAAYIASAVDEIDGPVILVGHCYGGAVITAARAAGNVVGLVYVAGFALDEGESALASSSVRR